MKTKSITLDSYFSSEDFSIDLVKLDIEGAEFLALKGMSNMIEKDKPMLVLEFNTKWLKRVGIGPRRILRFLGDWGYTLQAIGEVGSPHGVEEIFEITERRGRTGPPRVNLFCE